MGPCVRRDDLLENSICDSLALAGEGWGGVPPQSALFEWIVRSPTRRALARNCAAERVDLPPQAGEVTRVRACSDSIFKQPISDMRSRSRGAMRPSCAGTMRPGNQ